MPALPRRRLLAGVAVTTVLAAGLATATVRGDGTSPSPEPGVGAAERLEAGESRESRESHESHESRESREARASRGSGRTAPAARRVTVVVGAHTVPLVSAYPTVREVLLQAGVRLAAADRVSAPLTSVPLDGQVLTVTQVRSAVEREELRLPYQVVTRTDDELPEGRTRVVRGGRSGVLLREWATTWTDGVLTQRTLRGERVLRAPVDRLVVVGTGAVARPEAAPERAPAADGLDWAALAQCESGGNPRAVSPGGTYRGLYQFSLSTWRSVGGSGDPVDASSAEQTRRAQALYARAGRSPWPHCGGRL